MERREAASGRGRWREKVNGEVGMSESVGEGIVQESDEGVSEREREREREGRTEVRGEERMRGWLLVKDKKNKYIRVTSIELIFLARATMSVFPESSKSKSSSAFSWL